MDGTYELFRAHFSPAPDRPMKATKGMLASILKLTRDKNEKVTHIAVAFDNPIRSFRNKLYKGYKTEEGVEKKLLAQFDAAEKAIRDAGITVWSMKEFEADDALATAAKRFAPRVDQVRILTPDKDLGQCIVGRKIVQVDRMREREIDERALIKMRGIKPASIPDWLALIGDDADGIPGLDGFGEKGASKLLAKFGCLEKIPDDPNKWPKTIRGAERLAATLKKDRAQAMLYRTLTRLRFDVPLKESLNDLKFKPRQAI